MSLGPAVAGDGWPASSTWLGQRDTSLARTSVGAFQVAHAALPEEHSTRVPNRQDAAAEEIALRISGQNVQGLWLLTLRPCLFSSSRLVAPSRERWLGPGGACDAGKKQMWKLSVVWMGSQSKLCWSALCGLRAKPALCHMDLSCCPPRLQQHACLCKDLSSGFPVLLTVRWDQILTQAILMWMLWSSSAFCLCVFTLSSALPGLTAYSTLKCVRKCRGSIKCTGIPLSSDTRESLHRGSHMLHVHLGGRLQLHVGVFSWLTSCSRKQQIYLCEFPFSCLLFFIWLSCSSLLIYCMHSRGLQKGGVLKLFCFQKEKKLAGIRISVLELCRFKSPSGKTEDMREQIAGGYTRQKERGKKEREILELHPGKCEVWEVCFLSAIKT